eukprot:CAMPEP_0172526136 /NCGR_PEP_ID=MMETSP1067-20121228/1121_1 /TAXON_ID=265564 ORGANISM="Thalassiosira punctigera, Strain Tpunct2005C2" /NCGR_SAMPLE_ID=MMETSP1067 /ASSEMBLY_ACC=CAM_ASM_000444 /LENGTH=87 /DNA_ID=CAMNT_0013309579 /DNA_START=21 /DNA_END=285 /DNA_ORIENTATION=+
MAPKLYAMEVCLKEIKGGAVVLGGYPKVREYMDELFARPSFRGAVEYGPETVVWGGRPIERAPSASSRRRVEFFGGTPHRAERREIG